MAGLDPTGRVSYPPEFIRGLSWKEPCRVATTANVTISTALNAGDTIDGVTLAAGDRVLVKNQSTASQNGIYVAGVTPARAYDMDQDQTTESKAEEIAGAFVWVIAGTAGAQTLWYTTNVVGGTLGSTSITWTQFTGGGMTNPMTTQDDIIVGAASGVPARLAKGSDSQVLTVDPSTHHLVWATPSSGFANPMTTQDDIIVGGASGVGGRLAKGSDGQVLTVDPSTHHLVWATPGGGSGTVTTVKDEGSTLSSAVVSIDFVGAGVVASGTTAVTVTIPGGTGHSRFFPLDRETLDGTYGDEFDGSSLNGRWTRQTQGSGEETYQVGGAASALRVAYNTGAASRYIYQTAPNNTNEQWECCLAIWDHTSTGQMYGIVMLNGSGNGIGTFVYPNTHGYYMANIASGSYSSTGATGSIPFLYFDAGQRLYHRLRKASGLYAFSYSLNGESYSPEISFTPSSFTPTRVGVGRFLGTDASDIVDWYWFDKTA